MKLEITRNIVDDLWPLVRSGEASPDSRTLVESYLASDEPYRTLLEGADAVARGVPPLRFSPDAERELIAAARERVRMKTWLIGAVIGIAGLLAFAAFGGVLYVFIAR